ncbi:MAG: YqjD family protein [Sulfurifustaceae bacterium]
MEQAHTAVDNAEQALQSATERLARAAHQAVDTLSEYGGRAEDRLRSTTQVAGDRSREIMDQVREYVLEHPVAAIGIAAGVGFVLGMLVRPSGADESIEASQ